MRKASFGLEKEIKQLMAESLGLDKDQSQKRKKKKASSELKNEIK